MKTLIATAALLGGLVLMAGSANAQSAFQCQQYAQNAAEQQYPTGGGALGGGVFGTILGGGIAAATGQNVGKGAGIGLGAGLVVGSIAWQNAKKQYYDQEYARCLGGGGTQVYAPAPPVYGPPPSYPSGAFNAVITVQKLLIRNGPGTNYPDVGALYPNQVFQVVGCGGNWCQLPQGGFVYGPFIRPI